MSARIKVRPSPYLHGFIWWDCSVPLCPGGYGGGNTIAEAADAGRKHLRESHAPTARTQIHICTKCGLVSTCNRQPNGARA